ncbi:MAG: flagellar FlbD family protein [Elusimicrobia bacterium]|nr:flagellar FlbD family protein [Elusimicrobiota bacterium]
MIHVHRLNGAEMVVNAELIESLEPGHQQSLICLATGNRIVVRESAEEVVQKVVEYRRKIHAEGKVVNPIAGYKRE